MTRLSTVLLFTPEPERQREFYEKRLGLEASSGAQGETRFAMRGAALAVLPLEGGPEQPKPAPAIELAFEVGDLEARVAELRGRNVELDGDVKEAPDCRFACVRDPDGNRVRFMQVREPGAEGRWPRLSHAIVNTSSFAACVHFYHDVLGFKFADEQEHWVEFDTGETRLTVQAQRDGAGLPLHADQRLTFALLDHDFDAWANELRERGVKFAAAPADEDLGITAEVEDADGWFVVLHGPAPETPIEEALAEGFDDEDEPHVAQIRRDAEKTEPGARPGFGSRKLGRKKVERVATKGFDAFTKQRSSERSGTPERGGPPSAGGGFGTSTPRPFPPRPSSPRPFTPRPSAGPGSSSGPSRPTGPRPDRGPRRDRPQ